MLEHHPQLMDLIARQKQAALEETFIRDAQQRAALAATTSVVRGAIAGSLASLALRIDARAVRRALQRGAA